MRLAAVLLLASVCLPARAEDSAWSAERLKLAAAELIGPDAARRAELAHVLSHLRADARYAIAARLERLSGAQHASQDVSQTLSALRAIAGNADLALAVPELLARERSPELLAVVEPLLYLRALETMEDEGQPVLAAFVELDGGAWESELRQMCARLGVSIAPALIGWRADPSAAVRRFAQTELAELGLEEPRALLANDDPLLVRRALRAYANPPDFVAMPAIVRMLGDRRSQVRAAAREALKGFGKAARVPLRETYEEVSGQRADEHWDWERTAQELYLVLDRPRIEQSYTLFAGGKQALAEGDLTRMRRDYDALLTRDPTFEERALLAPGYAALAADLFRRDALEASLAAWRRALRLAPDAGEARKWAAQVAFVSAEVALTRGVVDLPGYRLAMELDPQLSAAREAYRRLATVRGDGGSAWGWWVLVGIFATMIFAVGWWRVRRRAGSA
ncbi:MAG TPA: hypothetical protein VJR89_03415 [Polyangiales bacterium]|nr:hypothetical protein [Polyangiales bacterium]